MSGEFIDYKFCQRCPDTPEHPGCVLQQSPRLYLLGLLTYRVSYWNWYIGVIQTTSRARRNDAPSVGFP